MNRLTVETVWNGAGPPSSAQYACDLAGNRTQRVANGQTTTYTCDSANRLTSWTGGGSASYDAAGNTTNIPCPDGRSLWLVWNSCELTAVYNNTNETLAEKHAYDALGRRRRSATV